jgi:hypothetical protein
MNIGLLEAVFIFLADGIKLLIFRISVGILSTFVNPSGARISALAPAGGPLVWSMAN